MLSPNITFGHALALHTSRRLSLEEWEQFCWHWRNDSYRFGASGIMEAARYAERAGLPPPYSDLPSGEWEKVARARGSIR